MAASSRRRRASGKVTSSPHTLVGWAKARKACSLRMDRMVRAPCPRGWFTSGASESHRNEFVVIDRLRVGNHAEGAELLERMPNDVDRLRAKRAVGGKAADLRVVNPRRDGRLDVDSSRLGLHHEILVGA